MGRAAWGRRPPLTRERRISTCRPGTHAPGSVVHPSAEKNAATGRSARRARSTAKMGVSARSPLTRERRNPALSFTHPFSVVHPSALARSPLVTDPDSDRGRGGQPWAGRLGAADPR